MSDTQAATVVLTKEEKLSKIDAQIAKLNERRYNIENDIVTTKAAKVVVLPVTGDTVAFSYGRKTPTSQPRELVGVVLGVKPASEVDGKRTPAMIKVTVGEGFDAEVLTIYPAQVSAINPDADVSEGDVV
jgi:hypothetical protein